MQSFVVVVVVVFVSSEMLMKLEDLESCLKPLSMYAKLYKLAILNSFLKNEALL